MSANTVFDVRVSGCEALDEEDVIEELREFGLNAGSFWGNFNRSDAEARLLDNCDQIAWVNINRRGSVAYVDIIEKKREEEQTAYDFCNVVAREDCVIEDITVKRGYAVVKKGDAVKRGDILISGVPPRGIGSFCMADGIVIARVNRAITVEKPYESEEKAVSSEQNKAFKIKIFNFFINIFDFCGNSASECDIIERKTDLTLFGKKIPISVVKSYEVEYFLHQKRYLESELMLLASEEMNFLVSELSLESEILKMKSQGSFTEVGYSLTTDLVLLREVGEFAPFEIN